VEPAFKLTTVVKKPAVTSLYTVDPLDPNHDATMRIEGEAPKQQQPILFPGIETMGGRRAAATSDRFWRFRRYARRGAKTLYFFFLPVADYAAECSLKPSGMTPSFA
jgi:hypothetical protein